MTGALNLNNNSNNNSSTTDNSNNSAPLYSCSWGNCSRAYTTQGEPCDDPAIHRRRVKTEEKAKVVVADGGTEFIQFVATLTILPWTILENKMNPSVSFQSSWCNSSYSQNCPSAQQLQCGKELNKFCPPNTSYNLCLFFCLYPSSML